MIGVRREERMTMSEGSFLRMFVRPLRIGPDISADVAGCFVGGVRGGSGRIEEMDRVYTEKEKQRR